jgi:tetratricopeptide (TPR) repeat protein
MLAIVRGDWAEAESRFRASIAVWREARIEDQALYYEAQLGVALTQLERFVDADTLLRRVTDARVAMYNAQHWTVGDAQEKRSLVRLRLDDLRGADSLAMSGMQIRRAVYGPRSSAVANQLPAIAALREAQGDSTAAIALLRETLDLLAELRRPPTDPSVMGAERALALALCSTGQTRGGETLARSVVSRLGPTIGTVAQLRAHATLGFCLHRLGRHAEAEAPLLQAARGFEAGASSSTGLRRQDVARWLVEVYTALDRPSDAARWRTRS